MPNLRILFVFLVFFLFTTYEIFGCKDQGTEPPPSSANKSYAEQIQPIFNTYCTGCHGASGGLNLSANLSLANLVNVAAQSSCVPLMRVLPNKADSSVLYRKVTGTTCGNRMPQGGSISTSDINLIRDWINQGANNN